MGRSYMQRDDGGVEERAWIAPDDKMAWGSIVYKRPFYSSEGGRYEREETAGGLDAVYHDEKPLPFLLKYLSCA
jgi:hypothetical protein